MEAGLLFSADAELTGRGESALLLLLHGWDGDDDGDDVDVDNVDDAVWAAGVEVVLACGETVERKLGKKKQKNKSSSDWILESDWSPDTDRGGVLEAAVQSGSQCERPRLHFLQTLLDLHQPQLHLHPALLRLPTRLLLLLQTGLQ